MDTLLQDLRFALRGLVKRPGFAAAALLTLAIGIGANTAVFSLVNALLLRPLPFGERSPRVVALYSTHRTLADDWADSRLSGADLEDVRAASRSLEAVAAYIHRGFTLDGEGGAERVRGGSITPDLFPLLGIQPILGRHFRDEECQEVGFEPVALLSHGLWQRRFGGDNGVIGRSLRLNGRALTIVGVMPQGFRFPERDDLWIPLRVARDARSRRVVTGFALLREGTTAAQAQDEVAAITTRLAEQYPDTNRGWGIRVLPFRQTAVGTSERVLAGTLLGAVLFVLLIGCANLANLLLARGVVRQREMALRTAVGASRGRLVRQMLVENALVALAGSAAGVALGVWIQGAAVASFPEELPYWIRLELDGRVLAFVLGLTVLTVLAFGLLPALRGSRFDVIAELKEGARGSAGPAYRRLQSGLVVGQVALCLSLLVGANLLVRSFLAMQRADSGFDERGVTTFRFYMSGDRYDPFDAKTAFVASAVERLAALPGVTGAALTSSIPIDDGGAPIRIAIEGAPVPPGEEPGASLVAITPGFFQTLGVHLRAGRTFSADEAMRPEGRVAIIGRTLAERFWPGGDPVGRRLGLVDRETTWLTVVGVAPDVQWEEFGEETTESRLTVYVPYSQAGYRSLAAIVRGQGAPGALAASLRAAMRGLDGGIAAWDFRTMPELRAFTTWEQRLFGETLGVFAAVALLLACLGVYGVLAYAVSRRVTEIGVRLALGARPSDVVRLVVRDGARMAALGIGLGLALGVALARVLSSVLYGVSAADPWAFAGTALTLGSVVLAASWLPARRAARIDPIAALRSE